MTGDLDGVRVLVPRPDGRGSTTVADLAARGAVAQAIPVIRIAPPPNPAALDAGVVALASGDFDWVGFTSASAVTAVLDRAVELRLQPAVPADTQIAAVGPATAAALRAAGLPVDLVPSDRGSAAALAAIWPAPHGAQSVLLPRSAIAADTLPLALAALGYRVETVDAYTTVPVALPASVTGDLAEGRFDAVLLTSSSTVTALDGLPIAPGTAIVVIGEPTAAAARSAGFDPIVADQPTASAVLDALAAHLAEIRTTRSNTPNDPQQHREMTPP